MKRTISALFLSLIVATAAAAQTAAAPAPKTIVNLVRDHRARTTSEKRSSSRAPT
jgi:hypothetical protein